MNLSSFRRIGSGFSMVGAAVYSGVSAAAVDATITDAISTGATDAKTVGAAVLVLLVGIVVLKYIRKAF